MVGRPAKQDAYEQAMKRAKNPPQRIMCECGKFITESRMEEHKKTDYHYYLLRLKQRNEEKNQVKVLAI